MNYLGLTNAFLIETGVSDVVASLTDAPDDVTQAAHWINSAWGSFQRSRPWPFRKAEGSHSIVPGTTTYTFTAMGRAAGDIIIPHSFYSSAGAIDQLTYPALRDKRRAAGQVDLSRVSCVAVRPSLLDTYPDITSAATLEYDYWKAVQALDADTDIPYGLPADFHDLIVHAAVAQYGVLAGGQEGSNLYAHHGAQYAKIRNEYLLHAGIDAAQETGPASRTLL